MIDAGYLIYRRVDNPTIKYEFDKSIGGRGVESVSTRHNNNRTQLTTFGKVPYVYYAGATDFVEFNLSTVFYYNNETNETARSQANRFKEMIDRRETLIVENSQKQKFFCDVNIVSEVAPQLYVERDMDYIEIEVRCIQIDY